MTTSAGTPGTLSAAVGGSLGVEFDVNGYSVAAGNVPPGGASESAQRPQQRVGG